MPRTAWLALIVCLSASLTARADDAGSFREQVAPLLERHCVGCHQGAQPKGGLDLAAAKAALAGGESGAAVVPGKPDESLLLEYVSGDKPSMPKDAPPLSAEEVATIRRWIAAGATWPDGLVLADRRKVIARWWSLEPLAQTPVPASDSPWIRTSVDAFIQAKLEQQGLAPSPEADRRMLLRRLTFDLHGLPPTPAEIDAFLADTSDDAYGRVVDRLLASPRYGERWGRYWLDVVHFGESHGYDKDKPRPNAWPYRDYVINSLNQDKPYDQFVAEQIAGDVLAPLDPQATVATGFVAAGPWDFVGHVELREGTVDKDIARSNDRDDMVANAMSTFLSLTVHCARCHDHKFDPIRQDDYYALQAVFAGVERSDRPFDVSPQVAAQRTALTTRKAAMAAEFEKCQQLAAQVTSPEIAALDEKLAAWSAEFAALPKDKPSETLGYHSQIMADQQATKWVQVDLGESLPIDQVILVPAHVAYGGHPGPGFGFPQRFTVAVSDTPDFAAAQTLADHRSDDFPHPGDTPYRIAAASAKGRYVRVTATRLWKRSGDWIFALSELMVLSNRTNVAQGKSVASLDSIEASPSWAMKNLTDGCDSQKVIATSGTGEPSRRQTLEKALAEAREARRVLVEAQFDPSIREKTTATAQALQAVDMALAKLPEPRQVYAAAPAKPRPIHLLTRGDVRGPRQLVAPAGVACVQGLPATFELPDANNEAARRAALARWLSDRRNALVRRSIVNRVWQYHFGQGIVDTPNDFGRMGTVPTHPELLEWLAGWFASNDHSLKKLHRLLVTSAVYRQSSANRADFARIDGSNRYLWRMNRQRLDAESIRDAVLAVSGKLDLAMGGPSVQQFYFKDDHSPIYDYAQFDVDDPRGLRRSVYRFLVRSVPDPFMECLDCADPSIMTPKRNATLTSIQALALLNNPFVTRQAEHFADRLRMLYSGTPGRIALAYRLTLGREPSAAEEAALVQYADQFGLPSACRVLLNSNEFVFID